jgi:predicted ATPase
MYEILHGESVPLRRLRAETPEPLERAVRKLLEKSQDDRYESARDLLVDLEAWDEGGDAVLRDDVPHNLPSPMTSFLGRGEEMRKVERLLESKRLLTLTGPGGVGKTRLAIEAARRMLGRFPDGVWFTPLEAVTDSSEVTDAIAASLDLPPGARNLEAISGHLRGAKALLVLDNFEQVADAAPSVLRLLGECPDLRVLAVSRSPLAVSGEQEMVVPPLEGPAAGAGLEEASHNPAVALFLERARAARPDFELTETNIEPVIEICARLDGLPLAIELAAARVKLFSPRALRARLGRRLDLIAGGARDAPERRQTLRKAIQWSYDLLEPEPRRVFRQLAVFASGGSLDAAATVAQLDEIAAADALQALASHHLIRSRESPEGEPAFEMSETIRHFALEALEGESERPEARRRHAAWFLALAERGGAMLTGPRQLEWLERLESEHANFAAAIDWAIEQAETRIGLRLASSLWRVWVARARVREGCKQLEEILALPREGAAPAELARALHGYATLAQNLGRNADAKRALEESLALWRELGDESGLAQALTNRAWVSCELAELDDAERLSREALALHERLGDTRGAALAWNNLGWVANYRADYGAAKQAIENSLALRRRAGDRRGEGFALACLAWSEQWHGDAKQAHRLLDEASRILLPVADPILLGWTMAVRAFTLLDEGKLDEACEILDKGSREWKRGANLSGEAWVLAVRGKVELLRGRPREADEQLGEAVAIWREVGSGWGLAMALGEHARALLRRGRMSEARQALAESLTLRRKIGDRRGLAHALETAAEMAGERSRAESLLAAAAEIRREIGAPASKLDALYRAGAGLRAAAELPAAVDDVLRLAEIMLGLEHSER